MQWSEIDRNPSARKLRQFAVLWMLFFATLGAWQVWMGNQRSGFGLSFVAIIGAFGLGKPTALRPVYVLWMVLAFPVGWAVSRVMLAFLFFGLFTPLAIVLRLFGRDALQLSARPDLPTYWLPKPATSEIRRYFRPY